MSERDEFNEMDDVEGYGPLRTAVAPSQVYSIRIPVERLEELRRVADRKTTPPSTLMRTWVLERLDKESTTHRVVFAAASTELDLSHVARWRGMPANV